MVSRFLSEHLTFSPTEGEENRDFEAFQRIRQNDGFPFIAPEDLSLYWAVFSKGKLLAIDRSPEKLHRLFSTEGITLIRLDGKEELRQLSEIQGSEAAR